jgi:hypothetical protein
MIAGRGVVPVVMGLLAIGPRFAARRRDRMASAWVLAAASSAFGLYGLWATIRLDSS